MTVISRDAHMSPFTLILLIFAAPMATLVTETSGFFPPFCPFDRKSDRGYYSTCIMKKAIFSLSYLLDCVLQVSDSRKGSFGWQGLHTEP